ncbi:MAG: amidohydrolase family protein [Acetobacteraceae bacterium]
MPTTLPIIDAHHHLWDLTRNHYPWLEARPLGPSVAGDLAPIARSYRLQDYRADIKHWNVTKSVHVECGWDPADPVGETAWLQSVADAHGFPHGIVGHAVLDAPGVEAVLAGHAAFRNCRGIRDIVNWHRNPAKTYVERPGRLRDPNWLAGFALLKKYDLSFDLQLYPSQMPDAVSLARAHPDTPIILNHAGMPLDRDEAGISTWRAGMKRLAEAPNVAVKVSGLGMVDWHWTQASIRPFLLETIAIFGTRRAMFSSNFPVDKLYSDFDTLYGAFDSITADFSADERNRLFSDNARHWYRL